MKLYLYFLFLSWQAKGPYLNLSNPPFLGHISNLDNTCFWKLVECGKSDREAHDFLKVLNCSLLYFASLLTS